VGEKESGGEKGHRDGEYSSPSLHLNRKSCYYTKQLNTIHGNFVFIYKKPELILIDNEI
jgi:hypothetical protein